MIFAEESSRPKDRGCLRFKCSSFYELNAVNTLPVHDLSAVNDYILRFKYSSTSVIFCCPNQQASTSPVNVIDSQTYYFACSQPQTSQQKSDGSLSQPIGRVWIRGRNNPFDLIG